MRLRHSIASLLALCLWTLPADAARLHLVGIVGDRALVSIDGAPPRLLAPGERGNSGVRLLRVDGQRALFDVHGERRTVSMGQPYVGSAQVERVVLQADGQGHYRTAGSINGQGVRFLIDTGATAVALSVGEARRLGIDYQQSPLMQVSTANGLVNAYPVRLRSVGIGSLVLHDVEAMVLDSTLPATLLGMSFLRRTEMHQDGGRLTLSRRP